jgi:hypothetical protein
MEPRRGRASAGGPLPRTVRSNRRTRITSAAARGWRSLTDWLHRITRCHAHLCAIVRLYGDPDRALKGANNSTYHVRAAAGDPSLLHDAITVTIDELVEIRDEIQQHMDATPARTTARPGSKDKLDELARRAERGESLFVAGDAEGCATPDGSGA